MGPLRLINSCLERLEKVITQSCRCEVHILFWSINFDGKAADTTNRKRWKLLCRKRECIIITVYELQNCPVKLLKCVRSLNAKGKGNCKLHTCGCWSHICQSFGEFSGRIEHVAPCTGCHSFLKPCQVSAKKMHLKIKIKFIQAANETHKTIVILIIDQLEVFITLSETTRWSIPSDVNQQLVKQKSSLSNYLLSKSKGRVISSSATESMVLSA